MISTPLLAALLSTGWISLAPNLLLFVFPSFALNSAWLLWGQAIAAGGLMGDVFLHTLGHGVAEDGGLWILGGFVCFMLMDVLLQTYEEHHDHDHAHQTPGQDEKMAKKPKYSATVFLNLMADALHNWTDGLAIGASFASSTEKELWPLLMSSRGGFATLSILLHEIPHELGDYAVLLQNGCTKLEAIGLQMVTAIAAMIGSVMGVWAVQSSDSPWLEYATAGGFLYLSCVTILPGVLKDAPKGSKVTLVLAFCIGVSFLYAVHLLEEDDHHHHGHEHGHDHHHYEHHEDHHHHHHEDHHDHDHHEL